MRLFRAPHDGAILLVRRLGKGGRVIDWVIKKSIDVGNLQQFSLFLEWKKTKKYVLWGIKFDKKPLFSFYKSVYILYSPPLLQRMGTDIAHSAPECPPYRP